MTLKTRIECELEQLRSDQTVGQVRSLHLETENGRLACLVTAVDALACSFDSIVVSSELTADASIDQLRWIGERLVERLGYLMEPLDVIEVDEQLRVVQLRSRPPQRKDRSISYYELEIQPGESRLRRYEKRPGRSRETIPVTVTREVFHRLAADFASVMS